MTSLLPLFHCRATSEGSGLEMCADVGQAPPRSGLLAAPVPSEHNFNNAICLLLSDDFEGPWAKLNTTANNSIAHIFMTLSSGQLRFSSVSLCSQCLIEKDVIMLSEQNLHLSVAAAQTVHAYAGKHGGDGDDVGLNYRPRSRCV